MKDDFYYNSAVFIVLIYKIAWVVWWFFNPSFTAMQVFRKAIFVD